jgi:hypothetical protein
VTWGSLQGAGAPPSDRAERPRPLVDHRPITEGFCRVRLRSGLIVHDLAVFVGRKGPWANLPVKLRIDLHGRQKTKPNYRPMLGRRGGALADRFNEAAIALIRLSYLGDLAG